MSVPTPRPERYSPSLTVQTPLGARSHGPGLVIVSAAGASLETDLQQLFAQEGFIVAHQILSPSYNSLRIRDELREATEALDFHDRCSDKSRYGIIVYHPSQLPSLVEAINGNGEIKAAVFFGESPSSCLKPHISTQADSSLSAPADIKPIIEFLSK